MIDMMIGLSGAVEVSLTIVQNEMKCNIVRSWMKLYIGHDWTRLILHYFLRYTLVTRDITLKLKAQESYFGYCTLGIVDTLMSHNIP